MIDYVCNICGAANRCPAEQLTREDPSCTHCRSNVRTRSLMRTLALELFHVNLTVPEFPCLKSLSGLGISDIPQYSATLESKFNYRNTFHDRAPQFDLMQPRALDLGQYDFIIAADVLEHVPPPVEAAFHNAYGLLKPGGVAVLSVPYSIEDAATIEHFPKLGQFSITDAGGRSVLVNRAADGRLEVFDNLVFHLGATPSLEMREFSEIGLKQLLAAAGFDEVRFHGEEYLPYGISWPEPWSLPVTLRKGKPSFSTDTIRELMNELTDANQRAASYRADLDHLAARKWIRLGRGLGAL